MIQSFDLYSKNPNLNIDFPILILDVNHDTVFLKDLIFMNFTGMMKSKSSMY